MPMLATPGLLVQSLARGGLLTLIMGRDGIAMQMVMGVGLFRSMVDRSGTSCSHTGVPKNPVGVEPGASAWGITGGGYTATYVQLVDENVTPVLEHVED